MLSPATILAASFVLVLPRVVRGASLLVKHRSLDDVEIELDDKRWRQMRQPNKHAVMSDSIHNRCVAADVQRRTTLQMTYRVFVHRAFLSVNDFLASSHAPTSPCVASATAPPNSTQPVASAAELVQQSSPANPPRMMAAKDREARAARVRVVTGWAP